MTRLVARLVLAMLLLPMTGAVLVICFALFVIRPGPPAVMSLLGMWAAVYAFVGVYWVLLWRGAVRWTAARIARTIAATLLALAAGAAVATLCMTFNRNLPPQLAVLAGGGIVPIMWVLATVLIWRETQRERLERLAVLGGTVACPICGYNLAGLSEARCPECGSTFTLERLMAGQQRQEERAASL